tara:strand:+ start:3610 stop:3738 length:129 start_codon:yes stop_codon:yes gene_type:complete
MKWNPFNLEGIQDIKNKNIRIRINTMKEKAKAPVHKKSKKNI